MLIGNNSKRPNLQVVRRLKLALRDVLGLSEDALITVTQLACLEEDCAPLETVFGLLRSGSPQLQHKIHKETEAVDAEIVDRIAFRRNLVAVDFARFRDDIGNFIQQRRPLCCCGIPPAVLCGICSVQSHLYVFFLGSRIFGDKGIINW